MMSEKRIRHLPVIDGNKLVGIIAMRDIMRHRLDAIQRTSRLVGNLVVSEHSAEGVCRPGSAAR